MANQFASELAELFKAATGFEVAGSTLFAAVTYVALALLTLVASRGAALREYVAKRPRLAALLGVFEAVGFDGAKFVEKARAALTSSKK